MSTAPDAPKASKLGSMGTSFWLGLLALSLIVFGANTGVATWQGNRLAGASTGAADLQVLSQQLANQGRDAVSGNAATYKQFKQTKARVVVYRRPIEMRAGEMGDIGDLVEDILTEQVAAILGDATPEED
jgi:twitching motility protein PilJ